MSCVLWRGGSWRSEIWETGSSCDLRAGFNELQEGINGRFGVIVVVIEFGEAAVKLWLRS